MKNIKLELAAFLICSLTLNLTKAQTNKDDIIFKALNDEMDRSLSGLKLDKYKPPFYLAYNIFDLKALTITASMGSLITSNESDYKISDARLMVGDYTINDENFISQQGTVSGINLPLPKNLDYGGIRRSFWVMNDRIYKSAVDNYEQKLTALKLQNKEESEKVDDYTRATPVNLIMSEIQYKIEKGFWENIARELSSVFRGYGRISSSSVVIFIGNSYNYVKTSEGTSLKYPVTFAGISVSAFAQASDGEFIKDFLNYFAPTADQITSIGKIKSDIIKMADNLTALCDAPVIPESYSGPVIFEEQAVAELVNQRIFGNNGLIAFREPVYAVESQNRGSVNRFDNKMNQKICSNNITIKATSKRKSFNGIPLIGSIDIDAEGIVPADELTLVDKGILKTLLNDRIPTSKIKGSNGHRIMNLNGRSEKSPGVIDISIENGITADSLRNSVLAEAAANGLEYIFIIRKVDGYSMGIWGRSYGGNLAVSKPIEVYKVSTKTGEEQRVRSAIISDFPVTALKQIAAGTSAQYVYNTLRRSSKVSYIVPGAIVINDLNIEKDKSTKPKLPVVPNPAL